MDFEEEEARVGWGRDCAEAAVVGVQQGRSMVDAMAVACLIGCRKDWVPSCWSLPLLRPPRTTKMLMRGELGYGAEEEEARNSMAMDSVG
jgi:hypothetical protein